ncbi:hypothetical protein EST38_g14120 [Candolleomyces aberdarensis]|uniref:DUF659 domain-containing protein n=1 Tax=Candolleomyces aberdarensis TaxID=2316362 RepID=A0A4Q2D0T9_9AGAR|nr:hypothetical protein EST38_g14120 [Candolleomyces aberdarensis]
MIMANGKAHTVDVVDINTEKKTAVDFLKLLENAVAKVEAEWGVKVIAIVTDASRESAKARREYAKLHPEVIVLDCYAHQSNLIVGDYFKADDVLLEYATQAFLVTFGFLMMQIDKFLLNDHPEYFHNLTVCQAVMDSLKKWWAKADQELFIGATLMNPFYGPLIFDTEGKKADQIFTPSAITVIQLCLLFHE